MAHRLKIENLNNFLNNLKKTNPELEKLHFDWADARCGKRIALASTGEFGAIHIKTDYITLPEMQQLLRGYMFKAENRFNN
jgi:hypothetical protein